MTSQQYHLPFDPDVQCLAEHQSVFHLYLNLLRARSLLYSGPTNTQRKGVLKTTVTYVAVVVVTSTLLT